MNAAKQMEQQRSRVMTRTKSTASGRIMLIGIGMLILTGWWWPGIMVVIGCAVVAERYIHGQVAQALSALVVCLAIPVAVAITQHLDVPWHLVGPFILIALGIMALAKQGVRPR